MKAFPGQMVNFINLTRDEGKLLFSTWSDRNPGTYYVMDMKTKSPRQLFKSYEDMDPAQLSPMMPLEFKDPRRPDINAFLTIPQGKPGAHAMVVLPHGGPSGIQDSLGLRPRRAVPRQPRLRRAAGELPWLGRTRQGLRGVRLQGLGHHRSRTTSPTRRST
jgi:hypothetical protein